ncbi:MAG TPA: LacI family DNA-binding transcriptional regulator [Candidatus Methylacidiphilales bacterium]
MPSQRDVARAAGLSVATVSMALRDSPLIHRETREAVFAAARRIGYEANPYVGQFMSAMRKKQGKSFKGNLALLWFDEYPEAEQNPDLFRIRKGAIERAEELGYNLAEFRLVEHKPRALEKILRSRGIRGVVVTPSIAAPKKTRLRLPIEGLACVALGSAIWNPVLHSIRLDHFQTMQLALHHARHRFGKGIAALWKSKSDRRADHLIYGSFLAHHPGGPALATRLFLDWQQVKAKPAETLRLFRQHGIEAFVAESDDISSDWLRKAVPERNVVYRNEAQPSRCYGYIDSQFGLMGKWGIDFLASLLQSHEYGPPSQPKTVLIPPRWIPGAGSAFQSG